MANHKHNQIQFVRTKNIYASKQEAINAAKLKVESNLNEFIDGEQIFLKYYNYNGEVCTSTAIIGIENSIVSISTLINDNDTYKVIESENAPEDTNAIWVTEATEDDVDVDVEKELEVTNLKKEVADLKKTLLSLTGLIEKHEYALTHSIAGGDFITNSLKYELENGYVEEEPEDGHDGTQYDSVNSSITSFRLFIGNTDIDSYCNTNLQLYKGQKYYLRPKFYNSEDALVDYTNVKSITITCSNTNVATITDDYVLESIAIGKINLTATLQTTDNRTIIQNFNSINFEYNDDDVSYYTYDEPNVRHMLIKKADTYDILTANTDYLCVNELVWCIGDENLYIKAQSKSEGVKLFKLTGSNSSSGSTETGATYTYNEDTESLEIVSNGTSVGINNNILNIEGYVDETGVLHLGEYSVDSSVTITVDENNNLNILSPDGTANVTDGILSINGTVDNNGVLHLGDYTETSGVTATVDENGTLDLSSNDGSVSVDNDILSVSGVVDYNGILHLGTYDSATTSTATVDNNGILDLDSTDGSTRVEDGILSVEGNVDYNGILHLGTYDSANTNTAIVDASGVLDLSSTDGSTRVEDGILSINGNVDNNGILYLGNIASGVTATVDENGVLDLSSSDGSVSIDNDILSIKGTVDSNDILHIGQYTTSSGITATVDSNGVLDLSSGDGSVSVEDNILSLNATIDDNGILTIGSNNTNTTANVGEDGVLDLSSTDNSTNVENNILTINGYIDENGILIINNIVSNDSEYIVDENGILTIANTSVNDDILSLNGNVDNDILILNSASTKTNIDTNNSLNFGNNIASVDSDGYLNLNLSLDENGYLIINTNSSNVNTKSELEINEASVNENSILTFSANIDNNGILTI